MTTINPQQIDNLDADEFIKHLDQIAEQLQHVQNWRKPEERLTLHVTDIYDNYMKETFNDTGK